MLVHYAALSPTSLVGQAVPWALAVVRVPGGPLSSEEKSRHPVN